MMETRAPHSMARLATSGLSVVWVPPKATRTSLWPGRFSALGGTGRIHQPLGGGAGGMAEDRLDLALLHHGAVVQDGHTVADFLDHAHLVGDDDHRDAQLLV